MDWSQAVIPATAQFYLRFLPSERLDAVVFAVSVTGDASIYASPPAKGGTLTSLGVARAANHANCRRVASAKPAEVFGGVLHQTRS